MQYCTAGKGNFGPEGPLSSNPDKNSPAYSFMSVSVCNNQCTYSIPHKGSVCVQVFIGLIEMNCIDKVHVPLFSAEFPERQGHCPGHFTEICFPEMQA